MFYTRAFRQYRQRYKASTYISVARALVEMWYGGKCYDPIRHTPYANQLESSIDCSALNAELKVAS